MNLNEVYFGKTEAIQQMEDIIRSLRNKYTSTKYRPGSKDPDVIRFNRLVEQTFGFKHFDLIISVDPVPAAATIPVSFTFSADTKRNNYTISADGYKFRDEFGYTCMVSLTTGLIFNRYFTSKEIMACILYELGRVFYSCMSEENAVLSNVYQSVLIANAVSSVVTAFMDTKQIADAMANNSGKNAEKQLVKMAQSDPDIIKNNPDYMDDVRDAVNRTKQFTKIATYVGGGIDTIGGLFNSFPLFQKLKYGLSKRFRSKNNTRKVLITFKDYLKAGYGHVIKPISDISKQAIAGGGKLLSASGITNIFVPYLSFISKAKNPLTYITLPVEFRVERAAENFPTMYGYGAEMTSYFQKMKSNDNIRFVYHITKNHPYLGIVYDVLSAPGKILDSVFDPTPDPFAQIKDQINMLYNELLKEGLDPSMKEAIIEDILKLNVSLNTLKDTSRKAKDPNICRKLYYKAIYDIFKDNGLGEGIYYKLLDDNKRFERYDKNYERMVGKHE